MREYDETDAGKPPTPGEKNNPLAVIALLVIVAIVGTDVYMLQWTDLVGHIVAFMGGLLISRNI